LIGKIESTPDGTIRSGERGRRGADETS